MPLVGLRPTKARLVMENAQGQRARDEGRARRRRRRRAHHRRHAAGPGRRAAHPRAQGQWRRQRQTGRSARSSSSVRRRCEPGSPAKFQVNVTMASDKFATLLRVANAGRLPDEVHRRCRRANGAEAKALGYRMRLGARVKVWDNHAFRVLPVTNFVMILPMEVPAATEAPAMLSRASGARSARHQRAGGGAHGRHARVPERHAQHDVRPRVRAGVVALAALAIGLAIFFR